MSALLRSYGDCDESIEVGIDEAGRGPMLGPVYAAAVVIPRDSCTFPYDLLKDSKKFSSKKKLRAVAEQIREGADAWAVGSRDHASIDRTNIRRATHEAMHDAARSVLASKACSTGTPLLLVDGNDFTPLPWSPSPGQPGFAHAVCIPKGDSKYQAIAAASILAKVARDDHIASLVAADPQLDERYGLGKNQGYGTKQHMDGLRQYGLSPFHRRSFGLCAQLARELAHN